MSGNVKKSSFAYEVEKSNPVEKIELYSVDALVIRKSGDHQSQAGQRGKRKTTSKRKKITRFTSRSWTQLMFVIRNTHVVFYSMITLTYPKDFPSDGRLVKKHLHNFRSSLTRRYSPSYFWFLEFQKRGAPHYHMFTTINLKELPGGVVSFPRTRKSKDGTEYKTWHSWNKEFQGWVSQTWNRIVFKTKGWSPAPDDFDKHLRVGSGTEILMFPNAAARYAAKHFAKPEQKEVPKGFEDVGRFWGCSRDVSQVQPLAVYETDSANLDDLLSQHNWIGEKFVNRLGYFPRVLFEVGNIAEQHPHDFELYDWPTPPPDDQGIDW